MFDYVFESQQKGNEDGGWIKSGHNDMSNTGSTSKEGWIGTGVFVASLISGGIAGPTALSFAGVFLATNSTMGAGYSDGVNDPNNKNTTPLAGAIDQVLPGYGNYIVGGAEIGVNSISLINTYSSAKSFIEITTPKGAFNHWMEGFGVAGGGANIINEMQKSDIKTNQSE